MKQHLNKIIPAGVIAVLVLTGFITIIVTRNYPIEFVAGQSISAKFWQEYLQVAEKLDSNADQAKVMDQLVKVKEEQQLVARFGLNLDQQAVDDEFNFIKSDKNGQYEKTLSEDFSNNENQFIEFVVLPQVYDRLLRVKYNLDFGTNNTAYTKAQGIIGQLNDGKAFEELAKTQSDDKISGQLGGDLGFVFNGQVLPELWNVAQKSVTGVVNKNIVISRLGYHILYPIGLSDQNGQKLIQLKHILIQTDGYESWLSDQLKNFTVWHL